MNWSRKLRSILTLTLFGMLSALGAVDGSIATVHPIATQAGIEALQRGGNAIDAVVAAALMLGVVDGENSGIGGGCLAVVRRADGRIVAIDGRETAPAAASRDMFVRDGNAVPELSQEGPLAVGVPGELATLDLMARRFGRLSLRDALEAAAQTAENGFVVTEHYAGRLAEEAEIIRRHREAARIFLRPDGSPWAKGEVLRQPDLARTYRAIAQEGIRWFYRGAFAEALDRWMNANGGLITRRDLSRYLPRFREPVRSRYRDCEIVGFPPPSSGGVHVAQILNILEHFDLRTMGSGSADLAHVTAEAMKLAFADRARWLGDSDFVKVPRGLVAPEYAAELAAQIRLDKASVVESFGIPPKAQTDHFGRHTTHISAADADGNWVALTATVNTTLGSKVIIPETGVVLNNQMDDFAAQPGATNFFGLSGSEANSVAPRKRPLSSMSPTVVLRNGKPLLAVGAAGGPTIISQTVLAIIQVVDFDRGPSEALAQRRLHHQWRPDELLLESGWNAGVIGELRRRGHRVREVPAIGASQAVGWMNGHLTGAADPRVSPTMEGSVSN